MTQPLCKAVLKFLKKLKIELPHDLAFQILKYSEITTECKGLFMKYLWEIIPKQQEVGSGMKKKDQTKALNQANHSPRQGTQSYWGAVGDSKSMSLCCPNQLTNLVVCLLIHSH